MPSIIDSTGKKVKFKSILINFTEPVHEKLSEMSINLDKSINQIVRDMVYRELQLIDMSKTSNGNYISQS